jgi:hypothetical protein
LHGNCSGERQEIVEVEVLRLRITMFLMPVLRSTQGAPQLARAMLPVRSGRSGGSSAASPHCWKTTTTIKALERHVDIHCLHDICKPRSRFKHSRCVCLHRLCRGTFPCFPCLEVVPGRQHHRQLVWRLIRPLFSNQLHQFLEEDVIACGVEVESCSFNQQQASRSKAMLPYHRT